MRSSHGQRSASSSGWPALIFARAAAECRSSPSIKSAPRPFGQSLSDSRLAGAGDAHHDDGRRGPEAFRTDGVDCRHRRNSRHLPARRAARGLRLIDLCRQTSRQIRDDAKDLRRGPSSSTFDPMNNSPQRSRLVAVLGPTNTGKTHLAVERMLAHSSGMIGLPLRLLAREIYDRMVKAKGACPSRARHRRGKDRPRRLRTISSARSRRCRSTARSNSLRSTKSSSAPTPSAAMSSPIGCCTRAGSRRRC